jgi:Zn-dependent peptidase ImmA (M78 family)
MNRKVANINPKILKWARLEVGLTIEEISVKVDAKIGDYKNWEATGEGIPFSKLKELGKQFSRQIATFFMSEIPSSNKKPKDYRNLTNSELTKDVLLVMRKVNTYRNTSIEFEGEEYWKKRYSWEEKFQKNKKENKIIIKELRSVLGISIEEQLSFKDQNIAYSRWRNAIEDKLGIFVFQFAMPLDKVQGFCYSDYKPYSIVVNSKHPPTARIFTMFHELAHILKHQSGICITDKINNSNLIEFDCNKFAAEFLIPETCIVDTDVLSEITKYANKLKISREVYLRRIHDIGVLNDIKFFKLLDEIKSTYNIGKKTDGFVKPEVKSRAERGVTYYNMVYDSLGKNKINYTQAKELLGLSISKILSEIGK